jgi:hypothetical protein
LISALATTAPQLGQVSWATKMSYTLASYGTGMTVSVRPSMLTLNPVVPYVFKIAG